MIHQSQNMNLAVNARDAMPNGGTLRMDVETLLLQPDQTPPLPGMPPGQWVHISVSDSGVGIPQPTLQHIFEPFFTTKLPGKGTGLGLAQVYGIVKQHDGFVTVASEVGQGTTFHLYFPILNQPDNTVAASMPTPHMLGNGETILVVEDDPVTRTTIFDALRLLNYEVVAVKSGREAVQIYEQNPERIAVVLCDMIMPGMDGAKLYQRLRKKRPAIKMVIMTGYVLSGPLKELYQRGAIGFLAKPFEIQQVASAIYKILHEPVA